MPYIKTTGSLFVLAVCMSVHVTARALTVLCENVTADEFPQQVRERYERSDVVALVGPDPALVTWAIGRDEPLVEYGVLNVWKGEVGPSLYVNGYVGEALFGTRDGDSGPFDSIGQCLGIHDVVRTLHELYGSGYSASKEITESPLTRSEKTFLIAAAGVGLVCLGGLFWLVSFLANGHNNRMQRTRER